MKRKLIFLVVALTMVFRSYGTGDASTYFNVYVPPGNVKMGKDVCLTFTALHDSTYFNIVDGWADPDTDNSKSGWLMQGQSYVLILRNNGANDASYSGDSATKNDGDYYIITGSKLLFASQATLSDWRNDWVSSYNKISTGQKSIVYSDGVSSSPNDINILAYEDSTLGFVRKISTSPGTSLNDTNVNMPIDKIVLPKMLNVGEDIIDDSGEGENLLPTRETYIVLSTIDPNEPEGSPTSKGNKGFTYDNQRLFYTLVFQNSRSYVAGNTEITDNLNINNLTLLEARNSCHFQLADKKLNIYFDGVMLPCNNEKPDASKSFAIFKVGPITNVSRNAKIPNQASMQLIMN